LVRVNLKDINRDEYCCSPREFHLIFITCEVREGQEALGITLLKFLAISFPGKAKEIGEMNGFPKVKSQKSRDARFEFSRNMRVIFGMKLKWIALSGASGVIAILLVCLASAHGNNVTSSTPFIALSSESVPEIPAKSAELVAAAPGNVRNQTAREVLQAVAVIARSGVLPYALSAICNGSPEVAPTAVATAIELHPEDVGAFTTAALCAAPSQLEQIVFSACKAAPASCATVAVAASKQAPAANELILAEVGRALPEVELYLEEAEIEAGTNNVQTVIDQTVQSYNDASKARSK
jgi:hypothetical protein